MREIKFRAWDKNTERMWDIETWHIADEYIDLIELGKSVADINAERFWRKQSEIIIMQYTGIKDKNGVDIYEGDIVQYGEDRYFIFVVTFKYGCFYAHNIFGEKFMTDSLLGSLIMSEKVSVIGNIHENTDLLED